MLITDKCNKRLPIAWPLNRHTHRHRYWHSCTMSLVGTQTWFTYIMDGHYYGNQPHRTLNIHWGQFTNLERPNDCHSLQRSCRRNHCHVDLFIDDSMHYWLLAPVGTFLDKQFCKTKFHLNMFGRHLQSKKRKEIQHPNSFSLIESLFSI